jgi:hypothetical protein
MKNTKDCLDYVSSHAWLKKGFSKLKKDEIKMIEDFLELSFDKNEAAIKCNRLFMDRQKTKNFTTVLEIVSACIAYRY